MGSLSNPIFLVTSVVFLALTALMGIQAGPSRSWCVQVGLLTGFLYGVVVWGTLTYYFGLDGIDKLILAGSVTVDGIILCLVFQFFWQRHLAHTEAH